MQDKINLIKNLDISNNRLRLTFALDIIGDLQLALEQDDMTTAKSAVSSISELLEICLNDFKPFLNEEEEKDCNPPKSFGASNDSFDEWVKSANKEYSRLLPMTATNNANSCIKEGDLDGGAKFIFWNNLKKEDFYFYIPKVFVADESMIDKALEIASTMKILVREDQMDC